MMENNFNFTPYDKNADEAMSYLKAFDDYSYYQENLNALFDYIDKLEGIIYGYTE